MRCTRDITAAPKPYWRRPLTTAMSKPARAWPRPRAAVARGDRDAARTSSMRWAHGTRLARALAGAEMALADDRPTDALVGARCARRATAAATRPRVARAGAGRVRPVGAGVRLAGIVATTTGIAVRGTRTAAGALGRGIATRSRRCQRARRALGDAAEGPAQQHRRSSPRTPVARPPCAGTKPPRVRSSRHWIRAGTNRWPRSTEASSRPPGRASHSGRTVAAGPSRKSRADADAGAACARAGPMAAGRGLPASRAWRRAPVRMRGRNSDTASPPTATTPVRAWPMRTPCAPVAAKSVADLPGRDMRQRIHDEAAIEERDEHGMPRLRGDVCMFACGAGNAFAVGELLFFASAQRKVTKRKGASPIRANFTDAVSRPFSDSPSMARPKTAPIHGRRPPGRHVS